MPTGHKTGRDKKMEKEQQSVIRNAISDERKIVSITQREVQSSAGEAFSYRHPWFRIYNY